MEDTLKKTSRQSNSANCPWLSATLEMAQWAHEWIGKGEGYIEASQHILPLSKVSLASDASESLSFQTPVLNSCYGSMSQADQQPLSGKSSTSYPSIWERSVVCSHRDTYFFQVWACLSCLKSLSQHCHPGAEGRLNPWARNPTQYSIQHITNIQQLKTKKGQKWPYDHGFHNQYGILHHPEATGFTEH